MVAPYLIERQGRLLFGGRPGRWATDGTPQVIAEPIWATTTHPGLWVRAALDPGRYRLRIRVGDQELATLHPVA